MVDGNLINKMKKYLLPFLFGFGCFYSCDESFAGDELDSSVHHYIQYFKEQLVLNKLTTRDFIVKIKIDSSNADFKGYRISTYPVLLDSTELPNKIDFYKGFKVAYFTKKLTDNEQIEKMKTTLRAKNYYDNYEFSINSNYPEWVLMENNKNNCRFLMKNTYYQEIDTLIYLALKNNQKCFP